MTNRTHVLLQNFEAVQSHAKRNIRTRKTAKIISAILRELEQGNKVHTERTNTEYRKRQESRMHDISQRKIREDFLKTLRPTALNDMTTMEFVGKVTDMTLKRLNELIIACFLSVHIISHKRSYFPWVGQTLGATLKQLWKQIANKKLPVQESVLGFSGKPSKFHEGNE